MTIAEAMGQTLREARERVPLSEVALGVRLGVSRQRIHQYESGKFSLHTETLVKLAEALGTAATELLEEALLKVGEAKD